MSDYSLKQLNYGDFTIRYFILGNIAYFCPADIDALMAGQADYVAAGDIGAWDKVEVGRRVFKNEDFFEWFSEQFEGYDYAKDFAVPDPLPWGN